MAGSVFDSPLLGRLFATGEVGRLFSDTAEVRAMLLVEGNLAKVQGDLGVIPEVSARAISRAAMEIQVDPAALAEETERNGVSVPALVAAFRKEMSAPEHAQYVHWGATSQDIMDTALMLRLRQVLSHAEADIREIIASLASLADQHAATPMAARTYGQHATPTTFGAVVASWGQPICDLLDELPDLRSRALLVSLSGAAGTSAALGAQAVETRAGLAAALGLGDPRRSWHTDRGPILRISNWLVRVSLALGKMGEDLCVLSQSDVAEVSLGAAGGSSTMPQKQNPVAPSAMVALARYVAGLAGTLDLAAMQKGQRDGAAWFTEWMTLPQLSLATASCLQTAKKLASQIAPRSDAMSATLDLSGGTIHAEALSFAMATHMPRPEAQAAVKMLCQTALTSGRSLPDLAQEKWPETDFSGLFQGADGSGLATAEAKAFADRVRHI